MTNDCRIWQIIWKITGKIKDQSLFPRLEKTILNLETADSLHEIKNIIKLTGFKAYYRIRINDFRLGIEKMDENKIRLIIIAHRKDIYKLFP